MDEDAIPAEEIERNEAKANDIYQRTSRYSNASNVIRSRPRRKRQIVETRHYFFGNRVEEVVKEVENTGRRKTLKTSQEIYSEKQALKNHGLLFGNVDAPSDSDSGKSDFDEEYYKYKPQPIQVDPSQVVVIEKREDGDQDLHESNEELISEIYGFQNNQQNSLECNNSEMVEQTLRQRRRKGGDRNSQENNRKLNSEIYGCQNNQQNSLECHNSEIVEQTPRQMRMRPEGNKIGKRLRKQLSNQYFVPPLGYSHSQFDVIIRRLDELANSIRAQTQSTKKKAAGEVPSLKKESGGLEKVCPPKIEEKNTLNVNKESEVVSPIKIEENSCSESVRLKDISLSKLEENNVPSLKKESGGLEEVSPSKVEEKNTLNENKESEDVSPIKIEENLCSESVRLKEISPSELEENNEPSPKKESVGLEEVSPSKIEEKNTWNENKGSEDVPPIKIEENLWSESVGLEEISPFKLEKNNVPSLKEDNGGLEEVSPSKIEEKGSEDVSPMKSDENSWSESVGLKEVSLSELGENGTWNENKESEEDNQLEFEEKNARTNGSRWKSFFRNIFCGFNSIKQRIV
nr:probable serine/threonine-protein kinase kinX [Leptinotarsa decemlineata]XP_023014519.1 probable serine/threonine-protein kinase kinX [Leptinotarsa decemlineata]